MTTFYLEVYLNINNYYRYAQDSLNGNIETRKKLATFNRQRNRTFNT